MKRHLPLAALLCAQAALLLANLSLLPVWMDELFTWTTSRQAPGRIVAILERDIHPPLYYFALHVWPWRTVEGMRAFSAVCALAATVVLDRLWVGRWRGGRRWVALAAFAFSPCLLLYGRMARSYALQTLLVLVAAHFATRWLKAEGRGAWRWAAFWASSMALLYTHYVPGLALLAAFGLVAAWRAGFVRASAMVGLVLAGYLPWMMTLEVALRRWAEGASFTSRYALTGSAWLEQVLKVGYGAVSLTVGETFPALALVAAPAAVAVMWVGVRRQWKAWKAAVVLVGLAAFFGYLGSMRWVSFPFIGARLLWLLPFLAMAFALGVERARRAGRMVAALLGVCALWSAVNYFRLEGYLNKGYAAPLREIAARVKSGAGPADLVLIDAYNTDGYSTMYYLGKGIGTRLIEAESEPELRRLIGQAPAVWVVRNQRDISPGRVTERLEQAACEGRRRETTPYLPYEGWQKLVVSALPGRAPTHYYQLTRCGKE